MLISRKSQSPKLAHNADKVVMETVSSFKYLGVILIIDFKWNLHVDAVCAKACKLLGFLYRTFRGGHPIALTYLYKLLVLPVLGYCSSVWNSQKRGLTLQLEHVKGLAASLVTGCWREDWQALCSELVYPGPEMQM